jgi:MFS family permease
LTVALLPYSFYVFGQALGPVLAAPLSEAFGRRGTYVPSMLLFALFTLGAGCARSVAALIICRFLAGAFGSPVLSVSGGTIADIWMPHERALPMAMVSVIPFLAPSIGYLLPSLTLSSYLGIGILWLILYVTWADLWLADSSSPRRVGAGRNGCS